MDAALDVKGVQPQSALGELVGFVPLLAMDELVTQVRDGLDVVRLGLDLLHRFPEAGIVRLAGGIGWIRARLRLWRSPGHLASIASGFLLLAQEQPQYGEEEDYASSPRGSLELRMPRPPALDARRCRGRFNASRLGSAALDTNGLVARSQGGGCFQFESTLLRGELSLVEVMPVRVELFELIDQELSSPVEVRESLVGLGR